MSLADLPPLREALAGAGILADKRFGQHFLLDLNVCRKIVRLADVAAGDLVVEVGPGPGGLTRALLEAGARVVAIEKDPRFRPLLDRLADVAEGRLRILQADAMDVDEAAVIGEPAAVIANLPYNVGTPLLVKWLTGSFRPYRMTLMFQKEVALRIAARAGEAHYGRLAVLSQILCEVRLVMELPARAFTPPPKVDSAVVRLEPFASPPDDALVASVQRLAQAAFGQRRKMLRSSLRALGGEALCERAGVDAGARAETVPINGFVALARALDQAG